LKITDITTIALEFPDIFAFQDATVFPPKPGAKGWTVLFARIKTDEGIEGFAPANPGAHVAVRGVIEELKDSLIGG
jgi:L-alanine-DL-glutamate epimerase-like enolase superfamily enzyme